MIFWNKQVSKETLMVLLLVTTLINNNNNRLMWKLQRLLKNYQPNELGNIVLEYVAD